jgi:hypothetical protein
MDDAKKQKMARMFIAEYFRQLTTQERIVQKIVDKKWEEISIHHVLAAISAYIIRKIIALAIAWHLYMLVHIFIVFYCKNPQSL